MNGIESIAAERKRQIEQEGWTPEHDDAYQGEELTMAAASYLLAIIEPDEEAWAVCDQRPPYTWPFDRTFWKPDHDRRMLVKAGALIAARIDAIDRQKALENE